MVDSHRSFARAEFAVCLLGTLAIPLPADLLSELFPDAFPTRSPTPPCGPASPAATGSGP